MALAGAALSLSVGAPRLAADLAADLARIGLEAAGGLEAHRALHAFKATGVTTVGDKAIPFVIHAARPRCVRVETLGETGSLVRAFDGVHAPWKKDDPRLPPRPLGREEAKDFLLDADFDTPLFDPRARGISLDYAGEVAIEGRVYHKILASMRLTDLVMLYLDAETHLLVRRDTTKMVRGRPVVVEMHYNDFRQVSGVSLPGRIRTQVDGRVLTDTVIEDYEPNPELPRDFFAPPVKDWPRL